MICLDKADMEVTKDDVISVSCIATACEQSFKTGLPVKPIYDDSCIRWVSTTVIQPALLRPCWFHYWMTILQPLVVLNILRIINCCFVDNIVWSRCLIWFDKIFFDRNVVICVCNILQYLMQYTIFIMWCNFV